MDMQRSFRAVTEALDRLSENESTDFLARLVLILASELNDADRFEQAVERAQAPALLKETTQ